MDDQLISFKDMCSRFDVTPRTLRYYEYIELLSPRKVGRSRFYGGREIARMTLILRGRRFGFSLEEIRQWLQVYHQKGTRQQYVDWIDKANRQLGVLNGQRQELDATMDDLRALRDEVSGLLDGMPAEPVTPSATPSAAHPPEPEEGAREDGGSPPGPHTAR